MPLESKEKEWWYRVRPPERFVRFASKKLTDEIRAIIGFKKDGGSEIQSLRFSRSRFKSAQEVRDYVKKHPNLVR